MAGDYVLCEECRRSFVLASQPKVTETIELNGFILTRSRHLCVVCSGTHYSRKITNGRGVSCES